MAAGVHMSWPWWAVLVTIWLSPIIWTVLTSLEPRPDEQDA